eukprot:1350323-Rhodomonas_salina.1
MESVGASGDGRLTFAQFEKIVRKVPSAGRETEEWVSSLGIQRLLATHLDDAFDSSQPVDDGMMGLARIASMKPEQVCGLLQPVPPQCHTPRQSSCCCRIAAYLLAGGRGNKMTGGNLVLPNLNRPLLRRPGSDGMRCVLRGPGEGVLPGAVPEGGEEKHGKFQFASNGKVGDFASTIEFFGGLDGMIGLPNPNVSAKRQE